LLIGQLRDFFFV
jgi:hypothetical protein